MRGIIFIFERVLFWYYLINCTVKILERVLRQMKLILYELFLNLIYAKLVRFSLERYSFIESQIKIRARLF